MKMILFSDIHHGMVNGGVFKGVQRKLPHMAIPVAEKLIEEINKIDPDIVINLGDLIDDVKDYNKDVVLLKEIWNVLKRIGQPFYSVVGNHDIQTIDRFEVARLMGYENPTFSVDLKGYHFVFLGISTDVCTENGSSVKRRTISRNDLEWLKSDIAKNRLPSLVFIHHGLAEDDMKGNFWFEGNMKGALLLNRAELKKVLKTDTNLVAVFSGHQHWTKTIVEDGIVYHLIGSLTENIKGNGVPDGLWFEVDVEGKKTSLKEQHVKL